MNATEQKILDLLNMDPFLFPDELVEKSGGALRLPSIYTDLRRMERRGLGEGTSYSSGESLLRRRFYCVTEAGIDARMGRTQGSRVVRKTRAVKDSRVLIYMLCCTIGTIFPDAAASLLSALGL